MEVDKEIKNVRSQLSKTCAELNRLKCNGRLTRKSRRNRLDISKLCGEISCYSLTCLLEKLKRRIKYLSRKRSRKLRSENARTLNEQFKKDQGKVFDKFRQVIDEDPDNMKPVYVEKVTTKKYFSDPKEVEDFWSKLWETPDTGNAEAPWLDEFEKKFSEIVGEIDEGDLNVTSEICHNGIRKKKNWSAPGRDQITNFWWKKLTSVREVMTTLFSGVINRCQRVDPWTAFGRVALLPKEGEWSAANQRPITCLNTQYKWLTSVLLIFHKNHLNKHQLMQVDQRGAKEGVTGTVNNLLIDDVVMRDAVLHKRNLFCYWIDVKKAFDSVSHSWLLKVLEIHRFPRKLITIFKNIMSNWSVTIQIPVQGGIVESRLIRLTNGILQGDSYCPDLYTLAMNLVSWKIRSTEGYKMSKPLTSRVTHTLFIDDLKGYVATLQKLVFVLNIVRGLMEDAGLYWNPKKCKFTALKRGKYQQHDDITLENGDIIKCLQEEDLYKFMGVLQHTKIDVQQLSKDLLKVIEQRSHIVWSSQLSDINKCNANNSFVNSAVEYFFWTVKFNIDTVKKMDNTIRNVMNVLGAKHTQQMNAINYLPRIKGGRGLRSLEETYKTTKIKLPVKIVKDEDPRMRIVENYHTNTSETDSYSIFKDAKRYSEEYGIQLQQENGTLMFNGEELPEKAVQHVSKTLKTSLLERKHNEVLTSTWQGLNLRQRIEDENVVKNYFQWMQRWQTCPTDVVNEFYLLFLQLLKTRCYVKFRSNETIDDIRCRLCGSEQESVRHIISNCGTLAKSTYITRHDNALKCFVWPLLKAFHLIDQTPTWYASDKVKPYYEKNNVRFWWDIPEYTGRDDESEHPPRPDGKLMFDVDGVRKIFLIEMTVPWTSNRLEKLEFKEAKYKRIQQSLKLENPGYVVDQITLVMDVFGGYGRDLGENIGKVIGDKKSVDSIVTNMQKSIISSSAHLSRMFKIQVLSSA